MEIFDQLMQLKAMTVRTGVLHEAQVVQLRNYPLLIPGVAINPSPETKVYPEDKYVVWTCKAKKGFKVTPTVKKWCTNIEKYAKLLLWDDTRVKIIVNGQVIYGK